MRDEKALLRAHIATAELEPGESLIGNGNTALSNTSSTKAAEAWRRKEEEENKLIALIDNKTALLKLRPILERLDAGKMDVTTAINKASKFAFMQALQMMFMSTSDKVKADLAKHFMALAGHTPTQKLELGRIDPEAPKQALMSMIAGAENDLKSEGIELVDDRETESKGTGGEK